MDMQTKPTHTLAEQAIIDGFLARVGDFPGDASVTSARDRLVSEFRAGGLPTRRMEAWHYTDLKAQMKIVPNMDTGLVDAARPLVGASTVLPVLQGSANAPQAVEGCEIWPFMDMLASGDAAKLLRTRGDDDVIGRLNGAFVTDGFCLEVADDTVIADIIELQAVQNGGQAHTRFPASFGQNSTATVIERHLGSHERSGFSSSISSVDLGAGAEVTWIIVQQRGDKDQHLGQLNARLGANSRLNLFIVNAGGKLIRQEIHIEVAGEGSHFNLRTINLLAGDSHTDVTLTLGHDVPNTTSSEIVRNVVLDRARGVFQGQIKVAQAAQKTDAQMACNTLLLSDDGEFAAKPELEIFADDVVCAHGATVIDIDRTQLFYLMARGISESTARGLLVNGFVDELVGELENEELVGVLETMIEQWLAAHA
ncbi:Fe-S cluster assembly protein SufD [Hoeflea marina]|uniref:Fe-S cluster assembly protein SufD n=1 Tax=Hoeflea marina TaxID=274592 RepID=A0A317PS64_9HYPH|nr:Fe-S cluster assembly protein SufD [Hoeflea marina]PWW04311.1 Fe-S cluster assembly protein SufD [Hoeflea marina]